MNKKPNWQPRVRMDDVIVTIIYVGFTILLVTMDVWGPAFSNAIDRIVG